MRNNKGQFVLGRTETAQEKEKRIDASKVAWKEREDYIGDLRFSPLYNVWRSFKFTEKGRKAGYSKEWNDFKAFFKDMSGGYCKGFRLGRLDKSQPFSKDNCKWMTESELSVTRNNTIVLEHNGEKRTLREWSNIHGLPLNGLMQRYHRGKGYSSEEILFGLKKRQRSKLLNESELTDKELRDRASKMVSAYRCRDLKRGFVCDIDTNWFVENISNKPCYYCGKTKDIGCDRIDNKIGHKKDNVLPCCYVCNVVRQDNFSVEEMSQLGEVIKKIMESRTNKLMAIVPDAFKLTIE